jgi:hypothetical protein
MVADFFDSCNPPDIEQSPREDTGVPEALPATIAAYIRPGIGRHFERGFAGSCRKGVNHIGFSNSAS